MATDRETDCNGACKPYDDGDWHGALSTAKSEILASVERRRRLVTSIVEDIYQGVMVLHARDGMSISTDQAKERARGIAHLLLLKYGIKDMEETP